MILMKMKMCAFGEVSFVIVRDAGIQLLYMYRGVLMFAVRSFPSENKL